MREYKTTKSTTPYEEWRACTSKKVYPTQKRANQTIGKMEDFRSLISYQCRYCFGWHIAHKIKE